ncbi:MAG: hypothetical protein WA197_16060 [Candidatus Acidiferrales bacterium]
MDSKKRSFMMQVMAWALAAPLALLGIRAFAQAQGQQNPQNQLPMPSPTPHNPNDPFPDNGPKIDEAKILKANNQQIHDDVEKLYDLASDLKKEVEKTDSANVLSLPMMQKAEQIEKLAKQVKNLARGN